MQLPREQLTEETITKLKAIAWDCDHLTVPDALKSYAEFAAKAVGALKNGSEGIAADLGYPMSARIGKRNTGRLIRQRHFGGERNG